MFCRRLEDSLSTDHEMQCDYFAHVIIYSHVSRLNVFCTSLFYTEINGCPTCKIGVRQNEDYNDCQCDSPVLFQSSQ